MSYNLLGPKELFDYYICNQNKRLYKLKISQRYYLAAKFYSVIIEVAVTIFVDGYLFSTNLINDKIGTAVDHTIMMAGA